MVSLRTLVSIAGAGGMITGITGLTLYGILQKRVKDSPVYQEVMSMIKNHPAVDELLGKPIKSSNVDISNSSNILSLKLTNLEVPVHGPKNKGLLYVTADRLSDDDQWNIYKIELEILDNLGGKVSLLNGSSVLGLS